MTLSAARLAAVVLALGTVAGCASSAAPTASTASATSTPSATTAPATTTVASTTAVPAVAPVARRWVELAETIVRADAPGPPTSARLYAYVTASYADARAVAPPDAASAAVRAHAAASPPAG